MLTRMSTAPSAEVTRAAISRTLRRVGDVGLHRERPAAARLDLPHHRLGRIRRARGSSRPRRRPARGEALGAMARPRPRGGRRSPAPSARPAIAPAVTAGAPTRRSAGRRASPPAPGIIAITAVALVDATHAELVHELRPAPATWTGRAGSTSAFTATAHPSRARRSAMRDRSPDPAPVTSAVPRPEDDPETSSRAPPVR